VIGYYLLNAGSPTAALAPTTSLGHKVTLNPADRAVRPGHLRVVTQERLVLEYAEAMTETPPTVGDEIVKRLLDHLDGAWSS
jgi:hypothetical protein